MHFQLTITLHSNKHLTDSVDHTNADAQQGSTTIIRLAAQPAATVTHLTVTRPFHPRLSDLTLIACCLLFRATDPPLRIQLDH